MDRDRAKMKKPVASIKDKFNSLVTGERKKKTPRYNYGTLDNLEQLHHFQATINRLSDQEVNSKFEQMLDDMNLDEEKKAPLRLRTIAQKKNMLAMQFKGMQSHGQIDTAEGFIEELNRPNLKGADKYHVVSSLRVALTNNPVSWVINFLKKHGLKGILKCLSYSCDDQSEKRSTLECIKCLRALSNSKYGLMQLMNSRDALVLLSRCVDTRDQQSMLESLKLLAAICLVPPNGHDIVLEAMTTCGEMRNQERFAFVVKGLECKDVQMKVSCLQLINAMISNLDDLDFRLHLRNEIMRNGLIDMLESLESCPNEEVATQIKIFLDLKDEDAEEFGHRYENIKFYMDDPRECFELLYKTTVNTSSEMYFLSILQHLLTIRDDVRARPLYFQLIEECVTQIVLHRNGLDPDFRYGRRFQVDVEPLLGKLSEEMSEEGGTGSAPRHFRHRLDEAITARQECEARVATLEEKVKAYEGEISLLRSKVNHEIGSTIESSLVVPQPPPVPGAPGIPPPPLLANIPLPPPLPPTGGPTGIIPPPPLGAPFAAPPIKVPSFIKPKKKYNPGSQMKRANWTKINVQTLEKSSFWSIANEEKFASEDLFKDLVENFSFKAIARPEVVNNLEKQKAKELKVLDARAGQNLSILLSWVKVPYEEIKRRIIEVDEDGLTLPFVEQLLKLLPTQDLLNKLTELKDQFEDLSKPEQFGVVLSSIKRVIPRLSTMAFKMTFKDVVAEVKPDIVTATVALEEVRQSKKFGEILEVVLLVGNYMNAGSRNEQTIGFEMSFMPKLVNTKSTDNSRNLMHFLVEYLEKKHPHLLNFPEELIHMEKAARVSEESMQKSLAQMGRCLKQLEIDIKNTNNDKTTPPNDRFVQVMTPFLKESSEQHAILEGMHKKMMARYEATAKYFCFDAKKYTMEEFFGDVRLFLEHFELSRRDLERLREAEEKQRRAKEVQEERERERAAKLARKKQLIDMSGADDQEGVMDNLLEALKTGSAFHLQRERKDGKKRTPRVAGAERRAQLARSRSRQNVLSPESPVAVAESERARPREAKARLFEETNKNGGIHGDHHQPSGFPPTGRGKSSSRNHVSNSTPTTLLHSGDGIDGEKEVDSRQRTNFGTSARDFTTMQPSTPGMSDIHELLERLRSM